MPMTEEPTQSASRDDLARGSRRAECLQGPRPRSPWVALGVILLGSYGAVLNTTVVGVALPSIADTFRDGTNGEVPVDWVITSFLLGIVTALPVSAWLADRRGRREVYISSLVVFAAGTTACSLAPALSVLVGARFVQGLGSGALIPVGMTIVYEAFPPDRRGRALGVWGVGIMAAPAAGPPIGGWLSANTGWRWIFALFGVVAVAAAIVAGKFLEDSGVRNARRLDVRGWLLLTAFIVASVVVSREAFGWGLLSVRTVGFGAITLLLLMAFLRGATRAEEPIIQIGMFSNRTFSATMAIVGLLSVAQFARLNYLPVELQVVRGFSAEHVGFLLAPAAAGVALTMPLGGVLVDRLGARVPVTVGLAFVGLSMWQLGHLTPTTSDIRIITTLIVQGIGTGLAFAPTTVTAMDCLPKEFAAQASVTRALNREFGGAIGTATFGAVLIAQIGAIAPGGIDPARAQHAYNQLFLVASGLVCVAVFLGLMMPGRHRSTAQRESRASP